MLGKVSASEGASAVIGCCVCPPENEPPKRLGVIVIVAIFAAILQLLCGVVYVRIQYKMVCGVVQGEVEALAM